MLYIVGTSIGNIQDTTYRAVETLISADKILAEDTRTFRRYYDRVCALFGMTPRNDQKVSSFHVQSEYGHIPGVLTELENGADIALVSESGMPLISDPGATLIQHVIKRGLPFTVVPGPTAFATGMVHSGFKLDSTLYIAFYPRKDSELKKLFEHAAIGNHTLIGYESPHRMFRTLTVLSRVYPDAQVCVCREMTKKFEEVIRGKPAELAKREYKGEITLVMRAGK